MIISRVISWKTKIHKRKNDRRSEATKSENIPGKQEACWDQLWTPGQPSSPLRAAAENSISHTNQYNSQD